MQQGMATSFTVLGFLSHNPSDSTAEETKYNSVLSNESFLPPVLTALISFYINGKLTLANTYSRYR